MRQWIVPLIDVNADLVGIRALGKSRLCLRANNAQKHAGDEKYCRQKDNRGTHPPQPHSRHPWARLFFVLILHSFLSHTFDVQSSADPVIQILMARQILVQHLTAGRGNTPRLSVLLYFLV
jgi:hypothetical protein